MKKHFCSILLTIFLTGCAVLPLKNEAIILFSSTPLRKSSLISTTFEKVFNKEQQIFFGVYTKKPFPSQEIRIQIIKTNDKAIQYGWTLERAKDIEIDINKNYFTGSFNLYQAGYYIFRIFSPEDKDKPIAQTDFRIE